MRYAFVLLVILAGCPLHNPVPVEPVYPASAIAEACSNLRMLGCPEGFGGINGETCERTLAHATELRPLPVVCWAEKKTVAEAKGCGSLRCIK
jgi:hypothetical protein